MEPTWYLGALLRGEFIIFYTNVFGIFQLGRIPSWQLHGHVLPHISFLNQEFSYSITYTATITTGVKDSAGNALQSNYTWSFTNQSNSSDEGNIGGDSNGDGDESGDGCFITDILEN